MNEYERLKKQRDEIIQKQAKEMAEKIADDIMTVDGGVYWERDQLIDRISSHLIKK